jgi:pimeloyl-ACP methyl ester carboxylesterase
VLSFIDNQGVELCIERRGNGRTHLLLLHGWISARRMWYDVVDRLDHNRFTVHMLDFRGCGLSDRPETGHHVEGYAKDVQAAFSAIGQTLIVAAHSMGGRVAQFVASAQPEQLERLILVAPGSPVGTRLTKRRIDAALAAWGSRRRIESFQRAAMTVAVPKEVMERITDDALVAQREAWFGDANSPPPLDFSERLGSIRVPTLCLAGENDLLAPPARIRRDVAKHIPGSRFVTLRNAGHNLPVEAPDEIAGAITSFAGA